MLFFLSYIFILCSLHDVIFFKIRMDRKKCKKVKKNSNHKKYDSIYI